MKQKIKRICTLLLCMAVILTTVPGGAVTGYAEEAAGPSVTVTSTTARAGNYAYLYVDAADFPSMLGLEFTIYYDDTVMTLSSCSAGSLLSGSVTDINQSTAGVINVAAMNENEISGSGRLLSMTFRVSSDAQPGDYPVTIAVGAAYDSSFQNITIKKTSGTLTVPETTSAATKIGFYTRCDTSALHQGDTVTYRLYGGYTYGLSGGNFVFEYDRDYLALEDVKLGSELLTNTALYAVNRATPGYVKISYADVEAISSSYGVEYVTLTFTVRQNLSARTSIRFSGDSLQDAELNGMACDSLTTTITMEEVQAEPDYPDFRIVGNEDFDPETRTFTVNALLDEGASVAAGDFAVSYNKAQILCTGVQKNEELTSAGVYLVTKENIGDGTVGFSYINMTPFSDSKVLLTLTFQAVGEYIGETVLQASGKDLVDVNSAEILLDYPPLTYNVPKLKASLTGTMTYEKTYGDGIFSLDVSSTSAAESPEFSYESSNLSVAQVDQTGQVLIAGAGTAEITIRCTETARYQACSGTVTVHAEPAALPESICSVDSPVTYTGSALEPAVNVTGLVSGTDYTVSYSNNVNAGTASVTFTGVGNYKGTVTKYFAIAPASLNGDAFSLSASEMTYTGSALEPAVYVSGLVSGTDYTVSYSDNVNAGTATVTITGKGNYTGTVTKTFRIVPAGLGIRVEDIQLEYETTTFDGDEKCPAVSIAGKAENQDYTVSYAANVNAGTAAVIVTGIGNYSGSVTKNFIIEPASLNGDAFSLSDSEMTYTGSALEPAVTVSGLVLGTDYSVSYSDNVNAGTATVTITGKGNYTGTVTKNFEIVEAELDLTAEDIRLSYVTTTFDGTKKCPAVTIVGMVSGTDYTVSYSSNVNAGTATVMITGKGNYTGTVTKTFEIQPASLNTDAFSLSASEMTYTGSALEPAVNASGLVLGTDYTVSYSDNVNVGTATVTINGKGNYTGTVTKFFEITAADLGLTAEDIKLEYGTTTFDGSEKCPAVTINGLVQDQDYVVSYANNVHAGTATVTVTGIGNYSGSVTKNFIIDPASLDGDAFSLKDSEMTFTGTALEPAVNAGGLVLGTDYTVSYSDNVNAGTATVTITGKGNYTGTVTKTFTIEPASLIDDVFSLSASEMTFTGSALESAVMADGLEAGTDYTVRYSDNVNVGTATVTITGKGNYTGTVTKYFAIEAAGLNDDVFSLSVSAMKFTGYGLEPAVNASGLVLGTDYTVRYSDNVNVGTATVTITGKGNYTGTVTKYFTIEAEGLNSEAFRLKDSSMTYTGAALESEVIASGLVLVTDYTVSYSNNVNAGTATVMITGKGNYTGTVTKTFIIEPASLNDDAFSLSASEMTFTGSTLEPAVNASGLVVGTDYTVSYSNNANVGTATVTISGKGNYTGTVTKTFTIEPASLNDDAFSLSASEMTYTGAALEPTVNASGLVSGTDYQVSYSNNINVGEATVTITGKGNYTGTVTKHFWIMPAELKLSPEDIRLPYDNTYYSGRKQCPTVTIDGLVQGQDYAVSYTDNINVGTATVTITGKGNYTGTASRTFEILERTGTEPLEGYSISTSLDTSGNTIDLIVKVDSNQGLRTLRFALNYDLTKLKLVGVKESETFPGDLAIESVTDENGAAVLWIWDGSDGESSTEFGTTATGTFATFQFMLTNDAAVGDELQINVVNAEGSYYIPGDNGETISGSIPVKNNAAYTVTGFNVTGTISTPASSSAVKELEGATVEILKGSEIIKSTTTDANGAYTITAVPPGTYTMKVTEKNHVTREYIITVGTENMTQDVKICLLGDVNMDGEINVTDINFIRLYILGRRSFTDYEMKLADVDHSTSIDVTDINFIRLFILGRKSLS